MSKLLPLYKKYPITLQRGEGVYLYDTAGEEYLDFSSGIAVCALGYNHPQFNAALKAQVDKILHTSNLYANEQSERAASNLARACGLKKIFFTNSGTESTETAMKIARKYALNKGIKGGHFIAFEHSFHGRTLGALSLTANYQKPFKPLMAGVKFAKFNDFESVERLVSEKTCAVVLESVQGEGGVKPAKPEFYRALRRLCDERDILLIADEIQCGMGRTGKFFAYEHSEVLPDVITAAKALGCGVPVGAVAVSDRVAENSLLAGEHGSTYGGNPLACAAVNAVFEIYAQEGILARVSEVGAYFERCLDDLVREFEFCEARSGLALMQGLRLSPQIPARAVIEKCQKKHLLLLSCGDNELRFLPPLIITKAHVDVLGEKLREVLRHFST